MCPMSDSTLCVCPIIHTLDVNTSPSSGPHSARCCLGLESHFTETFSQFLNCFCHVYTHWPAHYRFTQSKPPTWAVSWAAIIHTHISMYYYSVPSWYSVYWPTGGRRLSGPRHYNDSVGPMPDTGCTVYRDIINLHIVVCSLILTCPVLRYFEKKKWCFC